MSIIVAEQYARPIMPIIDFGYILENGAAVVQGTKYELMDNPDVKTAYLGDLIMNTANGKEYTFTRFDHACKQYEKNTAIIFLGDRFSFGELHDLVERFAGGLTELGIRKGDRIVLYLSNCVQLVVGFLAAQKIGAVVVLVSPIYTSHELQYMINDSEAKAVVCHDTNFGYVEEIRAKTSLQHVIVTNLLDMVSLPKRFLARLLDKAPHGNVRLGEGVHRFKSILQYRTKPPAIELDPIKDLSYILYTGGTTGFPKGVPGNHWGHTSYVNDITDDVFKGHLKHGQDTYIAINPVVSYHGAGSFHGHRPQRWQHHGSDARTPGGFNPHGDPKISRTMDAGGPRAVSNDPRERPARHVRPEFSAVLLLRRRRLTEGGVIPLEGASRRPHISGVWFHRGGAYHVQQAG
jgi:hypothetical protein